LHCRAVHLLFNLIYLINLQIDLMNVTLRQLRAFQLVAQSGSFTDAARRLHVTQAALSSLVKELEGTLNVRLFDRSTRSTKLSPAGSDFLPLAVKVLEDLDYALESTRQLQELKRGNVRVACTPLYSSYLLPQVIFQFQARFPGVQVRLLDSLNEEALLRLASGEADFAISPQRSNDLDIEEELLFNDRFVIICPPGHALDRRRAVTWTEAFSYPFIAMTKGYMTRLQVDLASHSSTLALQPAYEVSFLTTALAMVKAGLGITALPSGALTMIEQSGLRAIQVEAPVVFRQVSLFTRTGQTLPPAAFELKKFLFEATKDLRA
jgi:DNA-binding transcriptional LysR family regulator